MQLLYLLANAYLVASTIRLSFGEEFFLQRNFTFEAFLIIVP